MAPTPTSGRPRRRTIPGLVLGASLAALCPSPGSAPLAATVGVATVTEGEVHVIRGDALYSLVPGVDLLEQDVVTTGEDGYAQLEMADGSVLNVDAASKVFLSEYRLRRDDTLERAAVSVLVGLLRFVTAGLRADSSYELATNHMTIGIRGTEGVIQASEDDSLLLLEEGRVDVFELDEQGNAGARRAIGAGELVERRRAERLRLRAAAAFRAGLPARLRHAPRRMLERLARRHVRARKLRDVDYEDVRRLIRANPRIRKSLRNRFERRMRDPRFRERMRRDLEHLRDRRRAARPELGRAGDASSESRTRAETPRAKARAAIMKRKAERARRRRDRESGLGRSPALLPQSNN